MVKFCHLVTPKKINWCAKDPNEFFWKRLHQLVIFHDSILTNLFFYSNAFWHKVFGFWVLKNLTFFGMNEHVSHFHPFWYVTLMMHYISWFLFTNFAFVFLNFFVCNASIQFYKSQNAINHTRMIQGGILMLTMGWQL